jgi:hypothetical protein
MPSRDLGTRESATLLLTTGKPGYQITMNNEMKEYGVNNMQLLQLAKDK